MFPISLSFLICLVQRQVVKHQTLTSVEKCAPGHAPSMLRDLKIPENRKWAYKLGYNVFAREKKVIC